MVDNASSQASSQTSSVPTPTRAGAFQPDPDRQTFVLDTSVLLSDPGALFRFAEHDVVLPLVVVSELEGKRHHPELGTSPARPCAASTTCASSTAASTRRCLSGSQAGPCGWS